MDKINVSYVSVHMNAMIMIVSEPRISRMSRVSVDKYTEAPYSIMHNAISMYWKIMCIFKIFFKIIFKHKKQEYYLIR
jgi:hypothetical protein